MAEIKTIICPNLISKHVTPSIKWYQTDRTIVICIQLVDVSDYYLRVEDDNLQFSTNANDKEYYLILYLFGGVIAEKTMHKNVGREIKIYLIKALKWFPWLRLIKSKEKAPFISYNSDHIEDVQIRPTYDIDRFQRYKHENKIDYILPDGMSSDDESDDEDMDFLSESEVEYTHETHNEINGKRKMYSQQFRSL
ncbi:uncharacterized protein LOC105422202 [Pogonomyrmex barbatus]|uniref:RNA helicase n=1 Tax=Pogonomyrmex barbatus TaxID=144034 RepID=A0A6I9VMQ3_9HYME|nr:uncharacterized protein LOC105422202 [Pogonomyrmex barbatus]